MAYEIYHHGILGQKWGVRRFQNPDGSLTSAGRARAAKQLAKNEKYREKLSGKAQTKAARYKANAKESKQALNDLTKNGTRSQTFKKYVEDREKERERQVEFEKRYNGSVSADTANDWKYGYLKDLHNGKQIVKELIDEHQRDYTRYSSYGKQWANRSKNLMNMQVTADTSKRDIKNVYKGKE